LEIIGYGEDALTLWALQNRRKLIFDKVGINNESNVKLFYRPSFGRRGGPKSYLFGEFDFIIKTESQIVLGESKWANKFPQEMRAGDNPQSLRQMIMTKIIINNNQPSPLDSGTIIKSIKPDIPNELANDTELAQNIQAFLEEIGKFDREPIFQNLLILFCDEGDNPNCQSEEVRLKDKENSTVLWNVLKIQSPQPNALSTPIPLSIRFLR